eukprot:6478866-Amphidinium_carterae.2
MPSAIMCRAMYPGIEFFIASAQPPGGVCWFPLHMRKMSAWTRTLSCKHLVGNSCARLSKGRSSQANPVTCRHAYQTGIGKAALRKPTALSSNVGTCMQTFVMSSSCDGPNWCRGKVGGMQRVEARRSLEALGAAAA